MQSVPGRVLWVAILASFVAFLDGAIVNVALPAMTRELGGGITTQQWVVDAYLLALGSLILIAGSLSDTFGRIRILRAGLLIFGAASLACAVAPSALVLIVARGIQGAGAALLVPSSLALITSTFRGPAQGKAIGSWTAWTGTAFLAGPLIGGILVDYGNWRLIFAINVIPIAATLFLLKGLAIPPALLPVLSPVKYDDGTTSLPAAPVAPSVTAEPGARASAPVSVAPTAARVDVIGAVLAAVGLAGTVIALIEQERLGWGECTGVWAVCAGDCCAGGVPLVGVQHPCTHDAAGAVPDPKLRRGQYCHHLYLRRVVVGAATGRAVLAGNCRIYGGPGGAGITSSGCDLAASGWAVWNARRQIRTPTIHGTGTTSGRRGVRDDGIGGGTFQFLVTDSARTAGVCRGAVHNSCAFDGGHSRGGSGGAERNWIGHQ